MKKFTLLVFVALAFLSLGVLNISAQYREIRIDQGDAQSARSRFQSSSDLVNADPRVSEKDRTADAVRRSELSRPEQFGPGDKPVFILHVNQESFRRGEHLTMNLIPIVDTNKLYYCSIEKYTPGLNGQYDGTVPVSYMNADVGTYGNFKGTEVNELIKIHQRMFNDDDPVGRYTFSIAVWHAGTLVQQLIWDTYLTDNGEYPRFAFIRKADANQNGITLTGRFPVGIPIYYMTGVPKWGWGTIGPDPQYAAYANPAGNKVVLPGWWGFNRQTMVDVMLWSPYSRLAIVKPKAYETAQPQSTSISVRTDATQ